MHILLWMTNTRLRIYSEPTDPAAFKGLTADITWNIKKSELPFEPETKDTILPF